MKEIKANPDECIFKLRENIKKSRLTEAEREELKQCVQVFRVLYDDWKNIKQTEGDPNGE